MSNDDDIPVLTDLIEKDADITLPVPGLDSREDRYFEDDDSLATLRIEASRPPMRRLTPKVTQTDAELEHTIRRILDEHMKLAWQKIRLAIQTSKGED